MHKNPVIHVSRRRPEATESETRRSQAGGRPHRWANKEASTRARGRVKERANKRAHKRTSARMFCRAREHTTDAPDSREPIAAGEAVS